MSKFSQRGTSRSQSRSPDVPTRKFYVRSGVERLVVLAIDAEVAALRFVHNVFRDRLISGPKKVNKELQLLDPRPMKPLMDRMDKKIFISEAGFTRSEAGEFETSLVVARWRLQIASLEKIIRSTA